jgi:hypothetical protein
LSSHAKTTNSEETLSELMDLFPKKWPVNPIPKNPNSNSQTNSTTQFPEPSNNKSAGIYGFISFSKTFSPKFPKTTSSPKLSPLNQTSSLPNKTKPPNTKKANPTV